MAKYSLRQYNREVESLIDNGQIEEAIAHCKYILHSYPKYIDTYRLLGKTYLEIERYSEAADIFQRVLACIPDDLVSQIGMSMIREAQDDLDGAIWHMERAFDIQPSNTAVQEELRRLYTARDGEAPAKIRLSRGALIRMYARGKLFQQAIAEIHAALKEEPQRYDLRVQLARMYWLMDSKVKAAEECTALLGEYPFCLEANRILADILPDTSRAEDTKVFQERVYALDPYAQFASAASPLPSDVPDQAVMIDRLEWYPGMQESVYLIQREEPVNPLPQTNPITEAPDWLLPELETAADARSLEDSSAIPTEAENPFGFEDRLSAAQTPPEPAAHQVFTEEIATPPSDDSLIPDWMKGAGWSLGSGEIEEADTTIEEVEPQDEPEGGEIYAAEIPEWIRSLAPKASAKKPIDQPPTEVDFPDQPSMAPAELKSEEILQDIPEWLNPMLSLEGEIPGHPDIEDQAPENQAQPFDEILDIAPATPPVEEVLPPVDAPTPENATIVVQDETSNWLENLAAIYGSDKETLIARPEDRVNQPPGWVRSETLTDDFKVDDEAEALPSDIKLPEPEAQTPTFDMSASEQPEEEIPDWLLKLRGSETTASSSTQAQTETPEAAAPEVQETDQITFQAPETATPTVQPEMDNYPSWGVDEPVEETNEAPQPSGLYPTKLEDWHLEFDAPAKAPASDDTKTEPPFIPMGMDESEVEKLVENALPDWMTEIDPQPVAAVSPEIPRIEESVPVEPVPAQVSEPVDDHQAVLDRAREHLMAGDIAPAVEEYNQLIESGQHIDLSIQDLQQALYRYPVEPALWETLGNAYAQSNQLQDALDAYTKAEELIR